MLFMIGMKPLLRASRMIGNSAWCRVPPSARQAYSQVKDVTSTAEGIVAKAMKDGKPVTLVLDSNGQIKERD
ncbi:hypothetical protein ACQR1I_32710 [Bradyrhizobium sp. HKCCYLS2038]|uniref:hypothetical protein n=1 Tax=unclassified Bradyrhizobium TaxID=2631580 RepID=UPI003EBD67CB